ncbi:hypothetical protein SAY87_004627 [Trapa incisa]|uniref:Uncharacterized protein n=2 Tax=Trapa TaxID=22665 RepID=A0AAN7LJ72_TRANT|nr:hypothetical protein SAY87_004627 [Trapa incisa]KAK4782125.1 hypothetical protein SAY86_016227 [Trapa natans]
MANYCASDSNHGKANYSYTDPLTYGRSYDRADPSVYGRSRYAIAGTDPSIKYGGSDPIYGLNSSLGAYPDTTIHASAWNGRGHNSWGSQHQAPAYDYRGFDQHVTKVATEYLQPSGGRKTSGYGYSEYGSSNLPGRAETYDSFSSRKSDYSSVVPTYSSGGHQSQLSKPTSDITTAVHYIDGAAQKLAPGSRLAETTSKIHSYVEPVEPSKRYGNYSLFSRRSSG